MKNMGAVSRATKVTIFIPKMNNMGAVSRATKVTGKKDTSHNGTP